MLEILLYAVGVMYTPGPVNFISLNSGIQRKTKSYLGFFSGVAAAMFILFSSLGKLGEVMINDTILSYISAAGCAYIIYLAYKIFRSNPNISNIEQQSGHLTFRDGLMIQLLNPKGMLAAMPVSAVQFPAAGIVGWKVIYYSLGLTVLAFGAPLAYSLAGSLLGKKIENPAYFKLFNTVMASLLLFVALSIGVEQIQF